MPNSTIDGKKSTSIPPKVEAKIRAGEPKSLAMSTSGKPAQKPAVKAK